VKSAKNRGKVIQKTYVNLARVPSSPAPSIAPDSNSALAQNNRLVHAEAIGLNQIEGPEDVIVDRQGSPEAPVMATSSAFPDPISSGVRYSLTSAADP
jgi:Adipocyte plasma membrane-associated protein-like, N-terminal